MPVLRRPVLPGPVIDCTTEENPPPPGRDEAAGEEEVIDVSTEDTAWLGSLTRDQMAELYGYPGEEDEE